MEGMSSYQQGEWRVEEALEARQARWSRRRRWQSGLVTALSAMAVMAVVTGGIVAERGVVVSNPVEETATLESFGDEISEAIEGERVEEEIGSPTTEASPTPSPVSKLAEIEGELEDALEGIESIVESGLGEDVDEAASAEDETASSSAASSSATSSSETKTLPTIVHVVVDDVGANDLWSSTDLPYAEVSPNIREAMEKGIVLSNYYGQAYCTPARVALMTGRFVHRTGFAYQSTFEYGNVEVVVDSNYSVPLTSEALLLPAYLQKLGYSTHMAGKWNLGHCNAAYLPWNRGFDTFVGYFGDGISYVNHWADSHETLELGPSKAKVTLMDFAVYQGDAEKKTFSWSDGVQYRGEHTTKLLTDVAMERLNKASIANNATYVYLGYHGLHDNTEYLDDVDVNSTLWTRLDDEYSYTKPRLHYGKALKMLDFHFGRLYEKINDDFTEDGALLVFHADNGGSPCASYLCGNNLPFRGAKFSDFEGALKLPAFVYSPTLFGSTGTVRNRAYRGLMHHVDWLATFLALAGSKPDAVLRADLFDSRSHWDAIQSAADVATATHDDDLYAVRSTIYFSITETTAVVRRRNLKLVMGYENSTWYSTDFTSPDLQSCYAGQDPMNFLFDLDTDPVETTNLFYDPSYADRLAVLVADAKVAFDLQAVSFAKGRLLDDPTNYVNSTLALAWLESNSGDVKVVCPWNCDLLLWQAS